MFNKQITKHIPCLCWLFLWDGKLKRSWQWYVFYALRTSYDLAPDENSFRFCCVHPVPCSYCETEVYVQNVWGVCVLHILLIGINRVSHGGYRVLRRMHMFDLRVGTKPCLQRHLYEPAVFTQRAFLHGLTREPGSAHSSMSIQRVREWSSLKPALHSHMVPR